uniref:Nudix hydrolase domain-containing protein n=1 Tax=Steinernema glaseri TaxID=37863 RepID=A0A1I8AR29_9BILA
MFRLAASRLSLPASRLSGKTDIFGGITVDSLEVPFEEADSGAAEEALVASLDHWKTEGVRGVWFCVANKSCFWVPILVKAGFDFHHAQPGYVMLTRWLPSTKNNLPRYPFTTIGVGGLVVSSDGRILLMKEKRGHYLGWKFPGGASDPGESLYETAEREVFEETGVEAKATSILCFRHASRGWKDNMDIYFVCVMRPMDEQSMELKPCPNETAECQWMSREDIKAIERTTTFPLRMVLDKYDGLLASGPDRGCHLETLSVGNRSWQLYQVE